MATTAKAVAVFLVWHVYADVLLLFAAAMEIMALASTIVISAALDLAPANFAVSGASALLIDNDTQQRDCEQPR